MRDIVRCIITLDFDTSLVLPLNYNKILQGFIYRNIADRDLAEFVHDRGFSYGKRNFKMFTYSRLLGQYTIDKRSKKIIYKPPVQLVVSSCYEDFFIDLSVTLLKKKVEIAGTECCVSKMNILVEEPKGIQKIKMLSPVTAYSTLNNGKTVYYSPDDHNFKRIIKENIIKKYIAFFKEEPPGTDFEIECSKNKFNKVITKYDGFIIEGWMGNFFLKGNTNMIKLAYDTGIGGKNSQGFGCFELI